MASLTLVPVDHEPDFGAVSFVPVEHNPFSADDLVRQARAQLASQPERLPTSYGNPEADAAAMQPETYVNPYVRGLIDNAASLPQRAIDASGADMKNFGDHSQPLQSVGPAVETAMMMTGGAGAVPAEANSLRAGIKAYHGSPHDFDAFDLSKIGTGEGAQAYGHGLYFAENPQTAQAYRDALSGKPINIPSDVDSPHFQQSVREAIANNAVQVAGRNVELAKKGLTESINRYPAGSNARKDYEAALDMLHENPAKYAGRMYEVNINANPEHFLDWDKPVNPDTLAKVQSAAQNIKPNLYERMMGTGKDLNKWALTEGAEGKTGESTVAMLKRGLGSDAAASQALRDAGIPGIKYLDQGSRAAGDGSRNYVVFNDKLIDIVRKYAAAGIALPPAIAAQYEQMKASQPPANYAAGLGLH